MSVEKIEVIEIGVIPPMDSSTCIHVYSDGDDVYYLRDNILIFIDAPNYIWGHDACIWVPDTDGDSFCVINMKRMDDIVNAAKHNKTLNKNRVKLLPDIKCEADKIYCAWRNKIHESERLKADIKTEAPKLKISLSLVDIGNAMMPTLVPILVDKNDSDHKLFYSYRGLLEIITKSLSLYEITKLESLHKDIVVRCTYHDEYYINVVPEDKLTHITHINRDQIHELMFQGGLLLDKWFQKKEQQDTIVYLTESVTKLTDSVAKLTETVASLATRIETLENSKVVTASSALTPTIKKMKFIGVVGFELQGNISVYLDEGKAYFHVKDIETMISEHPKYGSIKERIEQNTITIVNDMNELRNVILGDTFGSLFGEIFFTAGRDLLIKKTNDLVKKWTTC